MYIEPGTNIYILKNVPLDTTYEHTVYFLSEANQSEYFKGLTKYDLTYYTYQRVRRGVARVGINSDNLYDCNYMMFKNSSFGDKWFYAFITSVEYVNNECSEIYFELDVMQTWFFDYSVDMCFVEREHSVTDNLFGNLVPENLDLGDYTITKRQNVSMEPMYICALTSKTADGAAPTGRTINGIYVPLNVIAGIPVSDPDTINSLLERFIGEGQEDSIVAMYQYPGWLGDASTTSPQTITAQLTPNFTDIDGYTPKNKKLFSYPYNMIICSNNNGQTTEYRWEQFSDTASAGKFNFTGVFVSTPCVLAYPVNYRGIENDYESGLTLSNFPQVPWVGDTFKAWLAQNKGTIATSMLSSVFGAISTLGLTTFNPAASGVAAAVGGFRAGSSVVGNVASILGKAIDAKNTPPQVHGQIQCDSLNAGMGRVQFSFYHTCIRAQFARIIDEYFTMFGYATRRVKIPNRSVRPHWNYVKTIGCTLTGSVPADDMRKLCSIYDTGVTFWKNGSEVGDYSLDNTIGG